MSIDYFYDGQLRRYFQQFIRIFTGLKYQVGVNPDGSPILRTIPAKLASQDRQVAHILRNNSENTMLSVPQISCFMTNISMARERTQNPNHVSSVQVYERDINPIDNKYTETLGRTYTVQRYMAIPYDITMQVDIWTSNELQRHQIMEQILTLFNPSIDLQTSTNAIDWTALTIVEMQDITWSSRSIPIGTQDSIDVSSITFKVPIWITPPAKILRQRVVEQIVTNINTLDDELREEAARGDSAVHWSEGDLISRLITTPGNHQVRVDGKKIYLLGGNGSSVDEEGKPYSWEMLLLQYGKYREGISQIRFKTTDDIEDFETDIVGTFYLNPNEPNVLDWSIDISSLPQNTLPNIDGIINPHKTWPENGLPSVRLGQRYMIIEEINGGIIWDSSVTPGPGIKGFVAPANSIIEYGHNGWFVAFDPKQEKETHYVMNCASCAQLKWDGTDWAYALDGDYMPGYWRLFL